MKIVFDFEASDKAAAIYALYAGLRMYKDKKYLDNIGTDLVSISGAEAYCLIEQLREQYPQAIHECQKVYDEHIVRDRHAPKNRLQALMDSATAFVKGLLPGVTYQVQVKKVLEEVNELVASPDTHVEYADVLLTLLVAYRLRGGTADELLQLAEEKTEINKTRKWGEPDADGLKHHIKE